MTKIKSVSEKFDPAKVAERRIKFLKELERLCKLHTLRKMTELCQEHNVGTSLGTVLQDHGVIRKRGDGPFEWVSLRTPEQVAESVAEWIASYGKRLRTQREADELAAKLERKQLKQKAKASNGTAAAVTQTKLPFKREVDLDAVSIAAELLMLCDKYHIAADKKKQFIADVFNILK